MGQNQDVNQTEKQKTDSRFKELTDSFSLDPSKLETPVIVPNVKEPVIDPFNMNQRLAEGKNSPFTNTQQFDILYPNHQSYYNARSYSTYDQNYKVNQEALLNKFKENLQNILKGNGINSNYVEDYKDKVNMSKINDELKKKAPVIIVDDIGKYDGSFKNSKDTKVEQSNPMKDIFH